MSGNTKVMIQKMKENNEEVITVVDHNIVIVRNLKYLRTTINNAGDETEEIKIRILIPSRVYYLLSMEPWAAAKKTCT